MTPSICFTLDPVSRPVLVLSKETAPWVSSSRERTLRDRVPYIVAVFYMGSDLEVRRLHPAMVYSCKAHQGGDSQSSLSRVQCTDEEEGWAAAVEVGGLA